VVPVHGGGLKAPILVWVLAAAFLLLVASLLIGAFTRPEFPPYQLSTRPATNGIYTLDASRADRWQRFRFAQNSVVDSGVAPWDVAFRRNHVITAPGAGALDLGAVSLDSLTTVPVDGGEGGGGYTATTFAADTVNAAIGKWYAYSMLSHLLTSKHHVYAVRTAEGGAGGNFVAFEILAYYCREVGAACYTIRYKQARPRG
jgi:hypothetical protein